MRAKGAWNVWEKEKMYSKIVDLNPYISVSTLNERLNTPVKRQILSNWI